MKKLAHNIINNSKINNMCVFEIFSCTFMFVLGMILSSVKNINDYYFDSYYYWTIADSVWNKGSFNLLSFPETYRGYLFAVIVSICKNIGGVWAWRVVSNLCVSIVFSTLLFELFDTPKNIIAKSLRGVLAFALFMFFWGDFVQYPLSDIIAFFFFLLGIVVFNKTIKSKKVVFIVLGAIVTGGCCYAAYNTRVIYFYGIIIWILSEFVIRRKREIKKLILVTVIALVGVAVVAMPQCMINKKYIGVASPKVYTEQLYGYSHSLQMQQVFWGIEWPRYETYVGDNEIYHSSSIIFEHQIGLEIIEREGVTAEQFSIKTWIKLMVKYPLDFCGIYVRHLFSIMTPVFREIYVHNVYNNKTLLLVLNIIIWFFTVLGIICNFNKSQKVIRPEIIIALLIPCVLQSLGAVEPRFFVSGYFLIYYYVCVEVDYRGLYSFVKNNFWQVIASFIIVSMLWITIVGDILSSNRENTLLINDNAEYYMIKELVE